MDRCPCCRQTLPIWNEIKCSLEENTVFVAGRCCKLSPYQTVIVHLLLKHQYQWVHSDQLTAALYGYGEQPLSDVLRVQITYIRRRFRKADLPLAIECNWHRYRLYYLEPKEQ